MNKKLSILIAAFAVLTFQSKLHAEETATPPAGSNVFLDEGEADYEMPKTEVTEAPAETKSASKKSSKKNAKAKAVAKDEDDDQSTAGTKGDVFDQMRNPEAQTAEKKSPSKKKTAAKAAPAPEAAPEVAAETAPEATTDSSAEATAQANVETPAPAPVAAAKPKHKALPLKAVVETAQETATGTDPAPPPPASRKAASVQFTQGFKTTKDGDCTMYADTDKTSAQVLVVKGAKKLWVEQNGDWFKAYHKKGSGFLPAECFE